MEPIGLIAMVVVVVGGIVAVKKIQAVRSETAHKIFKGSKLDKDDFKALLKRAKAATKEKEGEGDK